MTRSTNWSAEVLSYKAGKRRASATVRRHYLIWRSVQSPLLPVRCDIEGCHFYTNPLDWNGKRLPLILDHSNGNHCDDRPSNLRLLCPNCNAQQCETNGGANR